jgi:DNA-binding protein H-NS
MAKNTSIDLSKLSLEELDALVKDVQAELLARREAEREGVLNQMRELAASLGLTLEDVGKLERGKGAPAAVVQPKYRHPEDPSLTWSGRGKRPRWLAEALASGKSLEDFAI